jgi:hypothetical protein
LSRYFFEKIFFRTGGSASLLPTLSLDHLRQMLNEYRSISVKTSPADPAGNLFIFQPSRCLWEYQRLT